MTTLNITSTKEEFWTRDVAQLAAKMLDELGYHFVLTVPHNVPGSRFETIKGKAPGMLSRDTWITPKDWNDPNVKPSYVEAFKNIGRKTRFVPNLGVLLGIDVYVAKRTRGSTGRARHRRR